MNDIIVQVVLVAGSTAGESLGKRVRALGRRQVRGLPFQVLETGWDGSPRSRTGCPASSVRVSRQGKTGNEVIGVRLVNNRR